MAEFFACAFAGFVIAISIQIPRWMMKEAHESQKEFDHFLMAHESCRSDIHETRSQQFRFSGGTLVTCPIRRMDFGAPDRRGQMPRALCLLQEIADQYLTEGTPLCDYR